MMHITWDANGWRLLALLALVLVSGFFSSSETGLMALNRYRLHHMARQSLRAQQVVRLLARPDRLLGMILIGNTFANILASSIATQLAVRTLGAGEASVWLSSVLLTVVVLIFAEVMPKTVAALHPDRLSLRVAPILNAMMVVMRPLVAMVNGVSNALLRCFGVCVLPQPLQPLTREELRGLIRHAHGRLSTAHQGMLMGVLDLEHVAVGDVMVPRHDMTILDVNGSWETIAEAVRSSQSEAWLVIQSSMEHVLGVCTQKNIVDLLMRGCFNRHTLIKHLEPPRYVPERLSLARQLDHFLAHRYALGVVVDEYGEVMGSITVSDIVDEIIGHVGLAHAATETTSLSHTQGGAVVLPGSSMVRDVNRTFGWSLPVEGPNTLSGLIVEHLEHIPRQGVGCRIAGYPLDVLGVRHQRIRKVRVYPQFYREPASDGLTTHA